MYSRVNHTLRAKPSRLIIFLKREFPVNQLPPLNFTTPMPKKTMDRSSAHSRNRSSNNHHPYYHQHLHQGHGRARPGPGSNSGRYPPGHHQAAAAATAGFPPPPPPRAPHLPPNPMMPPSDFPHPSHFWPPPPFDLHGMPHPGPGPGPMMGEPWFDPSMPVPPTKGFNHFRHPYPPDHHPGHMGAPNYRGRGGNRGEGGGVYFNDVHNMAVPPVFDFSADGHSNSQLSNSDGMSAGGNIMIPPDHQMHPEGSTMQSSACRSHAPLRPMVELNKPVQESGEGGGGGEESATTVSVLSYNLLAQDLIRKNRYLYSDAVPELLEWDFRKTNLLKDLTESDADIFCLQEVQEDHYNSWFDPQLKEHGYTGVYQCRTGSHTDGCAVFYRTKSLELLEWKGLTYRQTFKVLNRDNVGIVLRFKFVEQQEQKGDAKEFCVATTHLLYNPKAGEVKLAQMSCLFAELHRMATIPGSGGLLPIVLCGDFNCTPNSPLVDFITSSFLNYSKMCATEVAGYNHRKSRSREIPSPLLPPSMNIGPNCIYMETMETDSTTTTAINSTPTATANGMAEVAGGNDMLCKKEKRPHSSSSSSHGSSHQKEERDGQHEKAVASTKMVGTSDAGDFVQSQNEGFKAASSSDGLSSKRYSKTRSARGAKARGMSYSGIKMSNFPSLTSGPKSTVKTSQSPSDGQPSSSSSGPRMADDKKPLDSSVDIEGDASTDDSDMDWERISTGDENQKSDTTALNSSTEAKPEPRSNSNSTGGRAVDLHTGQLSRSEPKKRSLCHIQGLITHPFKFITAYPQSRISTPSTVTTFHQSAFETVDYIFFTPPTKKRVGFHLLSRKALPSTHVLLDLGPQPHRYLSSDHLLLQACFQLVSRKTLRTN